VCSARRSRTLMFDEILRHRNQVYFACKVKSGSGVHVANVSTPRVRPRPVFASVE